MSGAYTEALEELRASHSRDERLGAAFVRLFPVHGAAVSTVGGLLGSATLTATDDRAVRLDRLQFDLIDGPCWEAVRTSAPVIEPDLPGRGAARWPRFATAAETTGVKAMFAFPLAVGDLAFGSVDLYALDPVALDPGETQQAATMAGVIGRRVLTDALSGAEAEEQDGPIARRIIHQATGIVLAQLDIDAGDALLLIRARALATGRPSAQIAQAVLDGELSFGGGGGGDDDGRAGEDGESA